MSKIWNWLRTTIGFVLILFCFSAFAEDGGGEVCREYAIAGLDYRIESLKPMVGKDTTNIDNISVYIGQDEGVPFIQSNLRSEAPDAPGTFAEFPTKIRSKKVKDLRSALSNIIFWGPPPVHSGETVDRAMRTVKVYLDTEMIATNGEIKFDISDAQNIQIVSGTRKLDVNAVRLLKLKNPPPAIIELMKGHKFFGRPPGRSLAIKQQMENRRFNPENFKFLSLIGDSGTRTLIEEQPTLRQAALRTARDDVGWDERLTQALAISGGKNLVVLGHMEGKNIAVDVGGEVVFQIPLAELRSRARAANADLILLACDTAAHIDQASEGLGIAGNVDSAVIVRRLEDAVKTSRTLAEITDSMASSDIVMVAYEELGGYGYAGATGFGFVPGRDFMARVFRLLALKK